MNYGNLLRLALRAISNNKLRSLLTMLGIIIGVGSVISMLAIGEGSKASIAKQISEMGSNMIMIRPGNGQFGGVRQSGTNMQTLKNKDYEAIAEQASLIDKSSPAVQKGGQVIYGNNNAPTTIYGVNQEYMDIRKLSVGKGSLFSDDDIASFAKVCVVGQTVVKNLFPNGEDPIGLTIRFDKTPFQIIGVLEAKGYNSMGQDQDDLIIAPYTTVQTRMLAINYLQTIYASAIKEDLSEAAIKELSAILRQSHNLQSGQEDDFHVRSQEEMSAMMSTTTNLMTVLLACVAGISLLVGGIGIMNIMYVSVSERTREIGLRMAIGAKGRHILFQFLIEAVIISFAGGLIGIILGVGAAMMIKYVVNWPIFIQTYSVILAFLVCTVIGVFFGWYPAKKAADLDPIDALRYE